MKTYRTLLFFLLLTMLLMSCTVGRDIDKLPTTATTSTVLHSSGDTTTQPVTTPTAPEVTPGGTSDDQTAPEPDGSDNTPTTESTPAPDITDPQTPQITEPGTTTQKPATTPGTTTAKPTTPGTTTRKPETTPAVTTPKPPVTTTTPGTTAPEPHVHKWSSWTTTKSATCTADGSQKRTCSGCSEVQTQTISATGHKWGSWTVTKKATCTANGVQSRTCSNCKQAETKTIAATGHDWSAWRVYKAPTTEEEGKEERICYNCWEQEFRPIDKLLQDNKTATPADCEWMAQRFLELLNEERAKVGAQQLVTSDRLHEMAQVRADELTVYFDHDRPDGTSSRTIYSEFEYGIRYDYSSLGFGIIYYPTHYSEDIGAVMDGGKGLIITKEAVLQSMIGSFKLSAGHWNDMMNDVYGAVGIAVSAVENEKYPGYYEFYFEILLVDRLYE